VNTGEKRDFWKLLPKSTQSDDDLTQKRGVKMMLLWGGGGEGSLVTAVHGSGDGCRDCAACFIFIFSWKKRLRLR
jgi:hypothetical protein